MKEEASMRLPRRLQKHDELSRSLVYGLVPLNGTGFVVGKGSPTHMFDGGSFKWWSRDDYTEGYGGISLVAGGPSKPE